MAVSLLLAAGAPGDPGDVEGFLEALRSPDAEVIWRQEIQEVVTPWNEEHGDLPLNTFSSLRTSELSELTSEDSRLPPRPVEIICLGTLILAQMRGFEGLVPKPATLAAVPVPEELYVEAVQGANGPAPPFRPARQRRIHILASLEETGYARTHGVPGLGERLRRSLDTFEDVSNRARFDHLRRLLGGASARLGFSPEARHPFGPRSFGPRSFGRRSFGPGGSGPGAFPRRPSGPHPGLGIPPADELVERTGRSPDDPPPEDASPHPVASPLLPVPPPTSAPASPPESAPETPDAPVVATSPELGATGPGTWTLLLAFLLGAGAVGGVLLTRQREREATHATPPTALPAPAPPRSAEAASEETGATPCAGPATGDSDMPTERLTHPATPRPVGPIPLDPERYRDVQKIGAGGMGRVYRARDAVLERDVAIKLIAPELLDSAESLQRFRQEGAALARMDHPGVVRVHDLQTDPTPLLVMEYVEGSSLQQVLVREGPLDAQEVTVLADALLDALGHAHERGVIHRDLKPGNILISLAGTPKIVDFGLARLQGAEQKDDLTAANQVIGTLRYMAPEQLRGAEADELSDQYSLALVLYECLTDVHPYQGEETFVRGFRPPPPPSEKRPGLGRAFDAVLLRALAPDPRERFDDLAAFRRALRKAWVHADRAGDYLAWVNVLLQANREVFHPLKGRLALGQRYADEPEEILALLSDDAIREGIRQLLRAAVGFLARVVREPTSGAGSFTQRAAGLAHRFAALDKELEAPRIETLPLALDKGFDACRAYCEMAARLALTHLVDARGWLRELAETPPVPGLEISLARLSEDLGEVLVPDRNVWVEALEKIVEVLFTNSAEAGAHQVLVSASVDPGPDLLVLEFRDDGPGLPPCDPERLFRTGVSEGKESGTGIGLPDARRRARALGGKLSAQRPGREGGAVFRLSLLRRSRLLPASMPQRRSS